MNYALAYPRFWLAYFVLSVVVLATNVAYDVFANPGSFGATSLVGTALALVGLRPLHGYVRQRRHDPRWLWKVLLAFYGFVAAVVLVICLVTAASTRSVVPALVTMAFILVGGPYLLALHQYLYRSPHLWA